jgi:hypothetical protein
MSPFQVLKGRVMYPDPGSGFNDFVDLVSESGS